MDTPLTIDPDAPSFGDRVGAPPRTTEPDEAHAFPHQQLTQNAPREFQDELVIRAGRLPGVAIADSCISVPGARAFRLDPEIAAGRPDEAFQCDTEFAHIHPPGDGSLHMMLPVAVYDRILAVGWGTPHPISGTMLVFGPRTDDEVELVWQFIVTSYRYALGEFSNS